MPLILFIIIAMCKSSYTHSYSHQKLAARFEKIFILASPPQRMSGEPRQAGIQPATIGFMLYSCLPVEELGDGLSAIRRWQRCSEFSPASVLRMSFPIVATRPIEATPLAEFNHSSVANCSCTCLANHVSCIESGAHASFSLRAESPTNHQTLQTLCANYQRASSMVRYSSPRNPNLCTNKPAIFSSAVAKNTWRSDLMTRFRR